MNPTYGAVPKHRPYLQRWFDLATWLDSSCSTRKVEFFSWSATRTQTIIRCLRISYERPSVRSKMNGPNSGQCLLTASPLFRRSSLFDKHRVSDIYSLIHRSAQPPHTIVVPTVSRSHAVSPLTELLITQRNRLSRFPVPFPHRT